jgi:hypothetical protein
VIYFALVVLYSLDMVAQLMTHNKTSPVANDSATL